MSEAGQPSPAVQAAPHPQSAVSVRGLSHAYPARRPRRSKRIPAADRAHAQPPRRLALDGVCLDIHPGEIFGILGPNGSGKTTLFRVLATLLRPTEGGVHVFGDDVQAQPQRVRSRLGVLFQSPSLDGKLTARENLMHQGHLFGLHGPALHQRIDELLGEFDLAARRDEAVERFSGGMRRRVELAKALLHHPRLLVLDEPATGLDPGARRDLWTILERMRHQEQVTVVLTTHLMDEADRCDRLAILSSGKLVALDAPATLKGSIGGDVVTIEPDTPGDAEALLQSVTQTFGPWPTGGEPHLHDGRIRLEKPNGGSLVSELAHHLGTRARSITVGKPTLEDVFLHLTGHTFWK